MSLIVFIQVFFVCLFGAMSPGPSMAVVINNAVFKNRYHGVLTSIGHGLGITIYAIFAVIGIGLIINTNILIFNGMKIISIMFLIYLGLKAITNKEKVNFENKELSGRATSFFQGLSIAILNPKILVWFVAIYSQFMSKSNDFLFNTYLVLIAGVIDTCWYILLTIMATSDVALRYLKSKSDILQKLLGFIFIMIGMVLILDLYLTFYK
tara:strand:+ start:493 stop:1119 length:627 start_codon:yes stop_codon:yes gene_type:complete